MISALVLFISFLLNLFLGLFVLLKGPKQIIRNVFLGLVFSLAAVAFGLWGCFTVNTALIKIALFGVMGIASFVLHFSLVFPDRAVLTLNRKHLLLYIPAITLPFLANYQNIEISNYGITREANSWYYPLVFIAYSFGALAIGIFIKKFIKSKGIEHNQLKLVLTGFIVAFFGTGTTNILLPALFHNAQLTGIGPLFLSAMPLFTAIAILKYQFMDISLVIKKGFVFSLLVAVISFIYIFGISLFMKEYSFQHISRIIIISAIIALGLPWLKGVLENITDKIFFRKKIDHHKETAQILQNVAGYFEENELINYLVVAMVERLKLESCSIFLDDSTRIFFAQQNGTIEREYATDLTFYNFFFDNPDSQYLVSYNIMDVINDPIVAANVSSEFEHFGLDIAYPLRKDSGVYAIIGIGKKLSEDFFSYNEIENFLQMTNQLLVIFERIGLYKEKIEIQKKLIVSQKNAAIGELTKKLVHEIKNPLVSLSAFFQLDSDDFEVDEIQRFKHLSLDSINRILKIIEDLVSFNKLTAKEYSSVDVNMMIDEELQFMMAQFRHTNITYSIDAADLPLIKLDINVIRQAMLNVFQNAVEAMPKGGHIAVKTSKFHSYIEISISDTGMGIPSDILPTIFEPLVTTKIKGTGLGLSITSNIIQEHNGSISVKSEYGNGTTFTITLPLSNDERGMENIDS
ncbi:MAG: hypothetical protein DKM50_02485 [Candidatus Margulisiibacteriota bacterium]|nr:MAG: hypothetical protein DKM50_02485 [Candidatus Margulisiibacteriota bacterium]HCY38099.1 hypothetical protein [Candidatus Margulisiibacteriota bacterium]